MFHVRADVSNRCFCAVMITVQGVTQWSSMETQSQQPRPASETGAAAHTCSRKKKKQTDVHSKHNWNYACVKKKLLSHSVCNELLKAEIQNLKSQQTWGGLSAPGFTWNVLGEKLTVQKRYQRALMTSYVMSFCLGGLWMFLTTHLTIHSMPSFTPSLYQSKQEGC